MHSAGSPQAQRIQIGRAMQLEYKKRLAKIITDVEMEENKDLVINELSGYFERVFKI